MNLGKARHLSRRNGVRLSIPEHVALPKFMTPGEIKKVAELKKQRPNTPWEELVDEVIHQTDLDGNPRITSVD